MFGTRRVWLFVVAIGALSALGAWAYHHTAAVLHLDQTVPVTLRGTIPLRAALAQDVQVGIGSEISARVRLGELAVPIDETLSVPLDFTVTAPVDTRMQVDDAIDVSLRVPIDTVLTEHEIDLSQIEVPIDTDIFVDDSVLIDTTIPIETEVTTTLGLKVPVKARSRSRRACRSSRRCTCATASSSASPTCASRSTSPFRSKRSPDQAGAARRGRGARADQAARKHPDPAHDAPGGPGRGACYRTAGRPNARAPERRAGRERNDRAGRAGSISRQFAFHLKTLRSSAVEARRSPPCATRNSMPATSMRAALLAALLLTPLVAKAEVIETPIHSNIDLKPGETRTYSFEAGAALELGWKATQATPCTTDCVRVTDSAPAHHTFATRFGGTMRYEPVDGRVTLTYANESKQFVTITIYSVTRTCNAASCAFVKESKKGNRSISSSVRSSPSPRARTVRLLRSHRRDRRRQTLHRQAPVVDDQSQLSGHQLFQNHSAVHRQEDAARGLQPIHPPRNARRRRERPGRDEAHRLRSQRHELRNVGEQHLQVING